MNLVIDIGNTTTKLGVLNSAGWLAEFLVLQHSDALQSAEALHAKYGDTLHQAILSTTHGRADSHGKLCAWLDNTFANVIYFNHTTAIPLKNLYTTPATLGMDRLAAAIGAWSLSPDQNLVVVDLGTAITFDFVTKNGEYLGGNISPGMMMRFMALHQHTHALPLCTAPEEIIDFGRSTSQAIEQGVVQGIMHEIEGYATRDSHTKMFFTGGDAFYFEKRVKSTIFANYELVLLGLNRILEYNAENQKTDNGGNADHRCDGGVGGGDCFCSGK